jgi:hypothetical protein
MGAVIGFDVGLNQGVRSRLAWSTASSARAASSPEAQDLRGMMGLSHAGS